MRLSYYSSWHRPMQLTAVAVLSTAGLLTAQAPAKKPPSTKSRAQLSHKPPKPKLTAQQKLGLRQLEIAQAEAAGLQPDMRAFVLWQASRGYATLYPSKADSLLKEALTVTQAIESTEDELKECAEPAFCGPVHWLQEQILLDLIRRSKQLGPVEQFLTNADPGFRQLLGSALLERYIDEKHFDRARQLLNQLADDQGSFPYRDATRLIEALPPEQEGDRQAIFSQALDSFTRHGAELYPMDGDFAIMVLRFSEKLPGALVLQAIDQLLDRAKAADESQRNNGEQNLSVGVSANKGDAYFDSHYEFRLFQLMAVLEQLDPLRAESLRRERSDVRAALERYPRGLDSLGALSARGEPTGIMNIGTVDRDNSPEAAAEQLNFEVSRRQRQINGEAEKNPRQALSDAMTLPLTHPLGGMDFSPRAMTLQSVAWIALTRNPVVSKEALQEIRKIADPMPPRSQAQVLEDLPDLYLRMGDETDARKTLDQLLGVAARLYEKDADLSDPNQAFKVWWPSSNVWWRCIAFAAKLDPSPVEQIIAEIQDDEIKAFERIAFANSLLGVGTARFSIIEKRKNGLSAFMQ